MGFELAIHESIVAKIETLPSTIRCRISTIFSTISIEGLEALSAEILTWKSDNEFRLSVTRKRHDIELQNGIIADGFINQSKKPCIYIKRLERVTHPLRITSKTPPHQENDKNDLFVETLTGNYVEINDAWIDKERENPFVNQALKNSSTLTSIAPVTLPMVIERMFYRNIEQIHRAVRAQEIFGFVPKYPHDHTKNYLNFCSFNKRIRFDVDYKNKTNSTPLINYLERFEYKNDNLLLVNFIDELDPLSLAQADFINGMVKIFFKRQYPSLIIHVVDVIIQDKQGRKPYYEEFIHYHGQHRFNLKFSREGTNKPPAPFTMVLGEIHEALRDDQYSLPMSERHHMFDVDLFIGCRGEAGYHSRDMRYSRNVKSAIYNLLRAAGFVTSERYTVGYTDLRRGCEQEIDRDIREILKTSAIIYINDEITSTSAELARNASYSMMSSGYPHVTIIQTNRVKPGYLGVPVSVNGTEIRLTEESSNEEELIMALNEAYDRNYYLMELWAFQFWPET